MKKFEVGKVYYQEYYHNDEPIITGFPVCYTVLKRTPTTITIQNERGEIARRKIHAWGNKYEQVFPVQGSYDTLCASMEFLGIEWYRNQ